MLSGFSTSYFLVIIIVLKFGFENVYHFSPWNMSNSIIASICHSLDDLLLVPKKQFFKIWWKHLLLDFDKIRERMDVLNDVCNGYITLSNLKLHYIVLPRILRTIGFFGSVFVLYLEKWWVAYDRSQYYSLFNIIHYINKSTRE